MDKHAKNVSTTEI